MRIFNEYETKKLLAKYGIPVTKGQVAKNYSEAKDIIYHLYFPIAMKISSIDIPHKTDVGGVILNIKSDDDIVKIYDNLILKAKNITSNIDGILIEEMAEPGVEVIVGIKKDNQFGHVIMFGLGGIFVEIFKDVSFRVLPIERKDALEMIEEIKGYKILQGTRGKKPANIESIVDILLSISKMVEKEDITEMDLNPIIVNEKGAIVVDARMQC